LEEIVKSKWCCGKAPDAITDESCLESPNTKNERVTPLEKKKRSSKENGLAIL
jgi:hypothetical protein